MVFSEKISIKLYILSDESTVKAFASTEIAFSAQAVASPAILRGASAEVVI